MCSSAALGVQVCSSPLLSMINAHQIALQRRFNPIESKRNTKLFTPEAGFASSIDDDAAKDVDSDEAALRSLN